MKKAALLLLPLLVSGCIPIVFPIKNPADDRPNVYGRWRITEIAGQRPAAQDMMLAVNSTNTGFSVDSECLKLSGHHAVAEKNGIIFGKIQTVQNRCTGNGSEQQLAAALHGVKSYRLHKHSVELYDIEGRTVAVAQRLSAERLTGHGDLKSVPTFASARHAR